MMALNKIDYIPVLSTITSAPARIIAGAVAVSLALIALAFSICFGWLHKEWGTFVISSALSVLVGFSWMTRGLIAAIPLLGNAACYSLDHCNNKENSDVIGH